MRKPRQYLCVDNRSASEGYPQVCPCCAMALLHNDAASRRGGVRGSGLEHQVFIACFHLGLGILAQHRLELDQEILA